MATYTSNVNRVTGLSTGMDIDSMVDQIMSAESAKYERLQKEQTWLTWQQEAYRDVITKLQDFQNKWFGSDMKSNLKYSSAFNAYTSTVTSNGVATNAIKIDNANITANFTIKVDQIATKESFTSTQPVQKGIDTGKTIDDIFNSINTSGEVSLTFNLDGTEKTISISSTELADKDELINVLNEKLSSAFGTETIGGNTKAKVSVDSDGGTLKFVTTSGHTLTASSNSTEFGITSGDTNLTSSTTKLGEIFGEDFDGAVLNFGGDNIYLEAEDTVESMIQKINDSNSNVTISYDSFGQTFKLEAKEAGASNSINVNDKDTQDFLKNCLKIDLTRSEDNSCYTSGQDALITINGIQTSRTTNDIEYNGLKFTLTEAAQGGTFEISSSQDVDSIYDKIVSFVDDYNSLIEELNSLVSQTRAKDDTYGYYEPLTDSEKEAMTEEEIKKWEEQAKTGLLYNDTYISSILTNLRSALYSSITTENGSIALYTIGITTSSDHTTNGKLVIDEDKLKAAISSDPESITALFTQSNTGLADQIDKIIQGAIGTNGSLRKKAGIENTSSVNDNLLSSQLKELAERLASEKERLASREARYYSLFSAMESAITQQNSQLEALYQILGQ